MDEELDWFRTMPADQRSWVTLVAQAGIASLVEWCRNPGKPPRLTGEVFGAAPRELVRAVGPDRSIRMGLVGNGPSDVGGWQGYLGAPTQ